MNNLFVQPRTEDLANEKTDLLITLLISHKHPPYTVYVQTEIILCIRYNDEEEVCSCTLLL